MLTTNYVLTHLSALVWYQATLPLTSLQEWLWLMVVFYTLEYYYFIKNPSFEGDEYS